MSQELVSRTFLLGNPNAHWAGKIPPGTYIVHAIKTGGRKATDHAIVTLEGNEMKSVHLYVAARSEVEPPPQPVDERCTITIDEVVGTRVEGEIPRFISISGVASGCDKIKIVVDTGSQNVQETDTVDVATSGEWSTHIANARLRAICFQGPVNATATCTTKPECYAEFHTDRLECLLDE